MKNISFLNKNVVSLSKERLYILIDLLYINDIKLHFELIEKFDYPEVLLIIRKDIFPFTDLPFAEYNSDDNKFNINSIKKVDYENALKDIKKSFSTDSSLLAFIDVKILKDFVKIFDFENLVDDSIEPINYNYWDSITSKFNLEQLALIYSLEEIGNSNGVELEGSGCYSIDDNGNVPN